PLRGFLNGLQPDPRLAFTPCCGTDMSVISDPGTEVMELGTTPMTERQRKYRENYRERVAGWYNGWLHIVLIYTIGFTALYVYLANLQDVRWWEYLTVPVVFMFANFFEWAVHRYVMHRPSNVSVLR